MVLSSACTEGLRPAASSSDMKPPPGRSGLRELRPGTSFTEEALNGQTREYRVPLETGTFLFVEIKQTGVDVETALVSPGGEPLARAEGAEGPGTVEMLALIAKAGGDHRLVVTPRGPAVAGRFNLKVHDLRSAEEGDESRVEAVRALAEARLLRGREGQEAESLALEKARQAFSLWEKVGDGWGEVEALTEIASIHSREGKPQEALAWYEKALAKARASGYSEGEASALANMAYCHRQLKSYDESVALYGQALEKWREIGSVSEQGFMFQGLGRVYYRKGDYDRALSAFQESLRLDREARDLDQQADALTGIGAIHFTRGDLSDALRAFEEALELSRAVGDTSGELLSEGNIAGIYTRRGQLQKAVEIYAGLVGRVKPQGEGVLFNNLGAAYLDLGDTERALENYERSRAAYRATQDADGEAAALIAIGRARQGLGDPRAALKEYEAAQGLIREESWDLPHFVGLARLALGEAEKARQSLERALEIARASGSRSREAQTLLALGSAHRALGQTGAGIESFTRVIALGTEIQYPSVVAPALLERATALRDDGRLADAKADVEKAVEIIESTRRNIAGQQIRTGYFSSRRNYYDVYIDLLMRLGQPAAALAVSERAHARGMLDLLAEGRIDVSQGLSPDLKQEQDELSDELSKAQALLRESKPGTDQARERGQQVEALYERLEELDWKARAQNPRYSQVDPKPLTLEEIQKQDLGEDTALLEYALGKERSFLFVVTHEGLSSYVLPNAGRIAERVRALRTALEREDLLTRGTYREAAYQLYQDLVAPASAVLKGKSDLVIVPDRALYYVPFEALLDEEAGDRSYSDLSYLLRKYAISYVPSASVLAGLRAPRADPVAADRKRLAAFAPFAAETGRRAQPSPAERRMTGWNLLPLPASSREVAKIAALYSGSALKFFAGDASESNVTHNPAVAAAERLHFATHAQSDERHPELSGLVLAPGEGKRDDGLLQVHEIFNLKLSADLVVLSACQTALGKEVTGEGLVGLTRAFFYAGVPSVVVSLWNVVDGPTPDLMLSFYEDLDRLGSRARALQQAKLTMISKRGYAHPAYWAPFILVGENR
jgi:CHAT domain-containing protein/Tfp pilus assembly protein PilF